MFGRFNVLSGSGMAGHILRIFLVITFLLGGFLLLQQAGQLKDILQALRKADTVWVVIGLLASALSYTAASVSQYAAGNWQGSFNKVHTIQWAGNVINRLLPFNVGSIAMTTRHYQKQGRKPVEALTVATLPAIISYTQNIILILLLAPFTIAHILERQQISLSLPWLLTGLLVVIAIVALVGMRFKRKIWHYWKEARGGLSSIKDPRQLGALIVATVLFTVLVTLSLYAAVQAVGESLPLTDILTLYLLSVFASSLIPTPGGIGGTEAALVAGLASLGVGLTTAVTITLIFRLMTFWAPLLPGVVALYFFRKSQKKKPQPAN